VKTELARLNHILIPSTKSGRDRRRKGRRWIAFGTIGSRLTREGRALLSVACASIFLSADPGGTESHVLVLATLSLLASALLVTRAYRLSDVSAELRVPRRVTVGEEVEIAIQLRNHAAKEQRCLRVELPFLPWDGAFRGVPPDIACLSAFGRATSICRAAFSARGVHQLDPFRVARLLPLGLSQGRPLSTSGAQLVVVPRVARVTSLRTAENRRHQPGGVSRASRTGDATDLLGIRPYRPGDPMRDLHARSWARHGAPMVREYQEEFFTRIGVVVDSDASAGTARVEAALSLAAGVVAHLCRGEAIVDVLLTQDHAEKLSLGRSLGSLEHALDVLAAVRERPGFSSQSLLARLGPHLERLSSVVFVALAWDEARAALVDAIRARNVAVRALVIGDGPAPNADVTPVPLAALQERRELWL
jgi:uncharacterized protein (DUF58 family)